MGCGSSCISIKEANKPHKHSNLPILTPSDNKLNYTYKEANNLKYSCSNSSENKLKLKYSSSEENDNIKSDYKESKENKSNLISKNSCENNDNNINKSNSGVESKIEIKKLDSKSLCDEEIDENKDSIVDLNLKNFTKNNKSHKEKSNKIERTFSFNSVKVIKHVNSMIDIYKEEDVSQILSSCNLEDAYCNDQNYIKDSVYMNESFLTNRQSVFSDTKELHNSCSQLKFNLMNSSNLNDIEKDKEESCFTENTTTVSASKFESMHPIWVLENTKVTFRVSGVWTKDKFSNFIDFRGYHNNNDISSTEINNNNNTSNRNSLKNNNSKSLELSSFPTNKSLSSSSKGELDNCNTNNTSGSTNKNIEKLNCPNEHNNSNINSNNDINANTNNSTLEKFTEGELLCKVLGGKYISLSTSNCTFYPEHSGPIFFKMHFNSLTDSTTIQPSGSLIVTVINSEKVSFNNIDMRLGWKTENLDPTYGMVNLIINSFEKGLLLMLNKLRTKPKLFAQIYLDNFCSFSNNSQKLCTLLAKKENDEVASFKINKRLFNTLRLLNLNDKFDSETQLNSICSKFSHSCYCILDSNENSILSLIVRLLCSEKTRKAMFCQDFTMLAIYSTQLAVSSVFDEKAGSNLINNSINEKQEKSINRTLFFFCGN